MPNYVGMIAKFLAGLTVLFAALKLLRIIQWSWWWVFAPLWTPILLFLVVAVVVLVTEKWSN